MPTADRRAFVGHAIRWFLAQDYEEREMIVLDDGSDPVFDLIPGAEKIRYFRLSGKQSVGAKRNLACREARGEIIVHWDDDDWMANWRLSYQVGELLRTEADVCGTDRVLFLGPRPDQAWQYVYPAEERPWVHGGTLCYTRALWAKNPFPDLQVAEDCEFLWSHCPKKIARLEDNTFYVGLIHAGNTSVKSTGDSRWSPYSSAALRKLMGADCDRCASLLFTEPTQAAEAATRRFP